MHCESQSSGVFGTTHLTYEKRNCHPHCNFRFQHMNCASDSADWLCNSYAPVIHSVVFRETWHYHYSNPRQRSWRWRLWWVHAYPCIPTVFFCKQVVLWCCDLFLAMSYTIAVITDLTWYHKTHNFFISQKCIQTCRCEETEPIIFRLRATMGVGRSFKRAK